MELKWLEDFIVLAETGSFSKSANLRHVTQPAFSRRIQALESWVGVALIDRSTYPTRLTESGQRFQRYAQEMIGQMGLVRSQLRTNAEGGAQTIHIAMPHTLSLSFFPRWLPTIEAVSGPLNVKLYAQTTHDAVLNLTEGGCDLVVCYHHPFEPLSLDLSMFDMHVFGHDRFAPYSLCGVDGQPQYSLPGNGDAPFPLLCYARGAYLERVLSHVLASEHNPLHFERRFETDMAEALKGMALAGFGVAFLPQSAVVRELAQGHLVETGSEWALELDMRIYRQKPSRRERTKPLVDTVWNHIVANKVRF